EVPPPPFEHARCLERRLDVPRAPELRRVDVQGMRQLERVGAVREESKDVARRDGPPGDRLADVAAGRREALPMRDSTRVHRLDPERAAPLEEERDHLARALDLAAIEEVEDELVVPKEEEKAAIDTARLAKLEMTEAARDRGDRCVDRRRVSEAQVFAR